MSVMATEKIRGCYEATVGRSYGKVRNILNGVSWDVRCMPSCVDWGDRFSETGVERFVGSSKGYLGGRAI